MILKEILTIKVVLYVPNTSRNSRTCKQIHFVLVLDIFVFLFTLSPRSYNIFIRLECCKCNNQRSTTIMLQRQ